MKKAMIIAGAAIVILMLIGVVSDAANWGIGINGIINQTTGGDASSITDAITQIFQ